MSDELVEALATIERAAPRVMVWGDGCRDVYRFCRSNGNGRAIRERQENFAGMAGGVAAMVEALGGDLLYAVRGGTVHERTFVDGELATWVEYEEDGAPRPNEHDVLRYIRTLMPQAILISDYGRGACTEAGLRQVIDAANAAGVPVLVEPHRQTDWRRYEGASLVKCNHAEWEANDYLQDQPHYPYTVVVTEGACGMKLLADGDWRHFTAIPIAEVDQTGAGDMVMAVLGVCLAAGIDLATACRLANVAAGLSVMRWGPAPVSLNEIRAALSPVAA